MNIILNMLYIKCALMKSSVNWFISNRSTIVDMDELAYGGLLNFFFVYSTASTVVLIIVNVQSLWSVKK